MRDLLRERWNNLLVLLYDCEDFPLEECKSLLRESWDYLSEHITEGKIDCADSILISSLAVFESINDYPSGVKKWEFDACGKFVLAIIRTIYEYGANNAMICRKAVLLESYAGRCEEVLLENFESRFETLSAEYKEDYMDAGEEE